MKPGVTVTWGREWWCEAQGRNDPLPCAGHWVYYMGESGFNGKQSETQRKSPIDLPKSRIIFGLEEVSEFVSCPDFFLSSQPKMVWNRGSHGGC